MYLLVVGAGRIGECVVEMATRDGDDVVVIEENEDVASNISANYDCLVLNGDATDPDILDEANIERADAVISTTDHDAVNTMVMLQAREYDVPTLVSVVRDPGHLPVFEKIGVTVVENPQQLIADYLYHSVRYPGVKDFMQLDENSELIELEPQDGAPITRVSLADARKRGVLPEDSLVAAIKRDTDVVTPNGDTVLAPDDLVTVLVNETVTAEVLASFGHETNGA